MDLNIADFYIVAGVVISAAIGIYRGFIREFLTVVIWIVASVVAYMYGATFGEYLFFIDSQGTKEIVGMIAVFLGVALLGSLIKFIICKAVKFSGVSPIDRLAGALFGVIRAFIIIVLVLWASSDNITKQDWYEDSILIPRFATAADMVATIAPKNWKEDTKKEITDFMKKEQKPAPVTSAKPTTAVAPSNKP